MEKRIFDTQIELRSNEERKTLVGSAAVFGLMSEKLGFFYERIEPQAFDGVLDNDVRALFNHDPNYILGRNKSGTLRLSIDEEGLKYEIDLPDTQAGRDLATSIARGDISQSSFAFQVGQDRWEMDGDDEIRVIEKINRLFDISPVTFPAYPDTSVAKRSHEVWQQEQTPPPPEPEVDDTKDIREKIKREIIKSAK
jgi:HK97 family phage prohead protease